VTAGITGWKCEKGPVFLRKDRYSLEENEVPEVLRSVDFVLDCLPHFSFIR